MIILRVYDVQPNDGPVSDTYLLAILMIACVRSSSRINYPLNYLPFGFTISLSLPYTPENLDVFGTVALSKQRRELICIDDPGSLASGLQCIGIDGLATDNCNVTISSEASINVNMCGLGSITRTFTATDDGGLIAYLCSDLSLSSIMILLLSRYHWPQI
jgi:hypothetical protein